VVHACWSAADIEHLRTVLDDDHSLNDRTVIAGTTKGSRTYQAIENVLKGPEVVIGGAYYFDKDGFRRDRARARWWDPDATTLREVAEIPGGTQLHGADDGPIDELPDGEVEETVPQYGDEVPVVYGHYWRTVPLRLDNGTTVCVDYSAGKGGPLAAYQWSGERTLVTSHLVAS
jgi:hypothetical protein